ncbi:MAG: nucleotidyltransferase domain-containing protein [Candidatus Aceula meridiana]|nr:nucleotidyltransferase domain-containing protein [Candidatus Aceula meridiana]
MKSTPFFCNFPKKLTLRDYQDAKKDIICSLEKDSRVSSIYSFGSRVEEGLDPGISDMDFLVLIKKKVRAELENKNRFEDKAYGSEIIRYILMNQPACYPISEGYLRHFSYFLCNATTRLQCEKGYQVDYGEFCETKGVEDKVVVLGVIAQIIEMSIAKICILHGSLNSGRMDARLILKILRGIKNNIKRMKVLGFTDTRWDNFIDYISVFRKDWHSFEKKDQETFLKEQRLLGLEICIEILSELDQFLRNNIFTSLHGSKTARNLLMKVHDNRFILFSDFLWNKKQNLFLALNKIRKINLKPWDIVVLPESVFFYFSCHAQIDSLLGRSIRSMMAFPGVDISVEKVDDSYRDAFFKQAEIYSQYWNFLLENGFSYGIGGLTRLFYREHPLRNLKSRIKRVISFFYKRNALRKIQKLFGCDTHGL